MTMTDSLVSILVPVYKRETLLVSCVESALAQSGPIEVVIVDNASPDGTWAVCQDLARADSRVRIFRNDENLGPVRNWQRCLDEARGTYAKLLFSDDQIAPDYLARTLPYLTDHPEVGFVFTAVRIGPDPREGRLSYMFRPASGVYPSRTFVDGHLMRAASVPISPGAGLFRLADLRRNLVETAPGSIDWLSTGAGPDVLLYLLTASQYPHVAFVAEPLSYFCHHDASISIANASEVAEGYRQAYAWFAANHCGGWRRARVLGRLWYRKLRVGRRWRTPNRLLAEYGVRGLGGPLVWIAAVTESIRSPFRRAARLFRQRPV